MKHYIPLFLVLAFVLLVACEQITETLPAQSIEEPTETLVRGTATATEGIHIGITVIPSATWSTTPTTPTKTLIQTVTPTIRRPTETHNPNSKNTVHAYERNATLVASFHASCDQFNFNDILLSPIGTWMAIQCGSSHDQTLEVISKEGKKWILFFKDYIAPSVIRNGDTGLGGLYPVHWTSDDEYLYFTSHLNYSGGGPCFYGFNVHGLYRMNVNTGTVSTVLAAAQSSHGPNRYVIAFSPGGDKLAFIAGRPVILDFKTGDKITIDPVEKFSGNPIWSPDGTKLAFSTCSPSEDFTSAKKSGIKIYSLNTHELKTIMEVEKNFLSLVKTERNQELKIVNTDIQTGKYDCIYFDWSSGQLTMPETTP